MTNHRKATEVGLAQSSLIAHNILTNGRDCVTPPSDDSEGSLRGQVRLLTVLFGSLGSLVSPTSEGFLRIPARILGGCTATAPDLYGSFRPSLILPRSIPSCLVSRIICHGYCQQNVPRTPGTSALSGMPLSTCLEVLYHLSANLLFAPSPHTLCSMARNLRDHEDVELDIEVFECGVCRTESGPLRPGDSLEGQILLTSKSVLSITRVEIRFIGALGGCYPHLCSI